MSYIFSYRFFLWEIHESGLKAIMRNECVASLLWSSSRDDDNSEGVTVEKVGFSESKKPVIVTSVGKAYIYRQAQLHSSLLESKVGPRQGGFTGRLSRL